MLLSRSRHFVFLHIPKTAGTSVHYTLRRACFDTQDRPTRTPSVIRTGFPETDVPDDEWHHPLARDVKQHMGAARWEQSFSFAFVRNPWARQVSWYNMIRERGLFGTPITFAEFLELPDQSAAVHQRRQNQVEWLTDETGEQIVDFVGRFENLTEDFRSICRRIGLVAELPEARYNASTPVDYRTYYTPSLRELMAERFADDIAAFGYEF